MNYFDLVASYMNAPRNVHTVPTDGRTPRWFWVSAEQGVLYVSSGMTPYINSYIKGRRKLNAEEFDDIFALYQRRKRCEAVSAEASAVTQNQVYWYGIFNDLRM